MLGCNLRDTSLLLLFYILLDIMIIKIGGFGVILCEIRNQYRDIFEVVNIN